MRTLRGDGGDDSADDRRDTDANVPSGESVPDAEAPACHEDDLDCREDEGDPSDRCREGRRDGIDHGEHVDALYVGSDGSYYTAWQLERRLERGTWRRCLSQQEPACHLVADGAGQLLSLERIALESAPPWLEVRVEAERAWVVDTRGGARVGSSGRHCLRPVADSSPEGPERR